MLFRPGLTRIPFHAKDESSSGSRRLQRIELDLRRDRHAQAAVEAYADSCAVEMPWLAGVLREAAGGASESLTRCRGTVLRAFDLAHAWAAMQPDYAGAAWDHVRIHLDAALAHRPAGDEDEEEGDERMILTSSQAIVDGFPVDDDKGHDEVRIEAQGTEKAGYWFPRMALNQRDP